MSAPPYRVLSLFAGIGGFDLGLERTGGFKTVAFCEIDPFCRRVLAKHWPEVPCYDDVRTLTAARLDADGIGPVDAICGGFPCQDISLAGAGAGIDGERSGLWREYARLIGELRPRYVIVENVAALLGRGLGRVLGDLAALGFDAEWHCIPASAVGAPHRRDRLWIVAHPGGEQHEGEGDADQGPPSARLHEAASGMADANRHARLAWRSGDAAKGARGRHADRSNVGQDVRPPDSTGLALGQSIRGHHVEEFAATVGADWWFAEPDVGRVANGVPGRVDRLHALGNAVVPQIPELIGRAILSAAPPYRVA